jgi:fructosamine-3-kinase
MPPPLPGGLGAVRTASRLGGGDIATPWRAVLADGREVVVKQTPYPAQLESEGLRALAAAGAPVPEVLAVEGDLLVMAFVRGTPDWEGLGAALAQVHRTTASAFGWHRDNRIGPLVQPGGWFDDWPGFYAEQRLRPLLATPGLPGPLRARLERALEGPLQALLATDPPASLVHGDLWSGNVVDGRWLIDPAVHHADRELDLAFAEVFGGFPAAFFRAYEGTWPLTEGWQERRPALQLWHLLVHVRLFGGSYAGEVASRLDALGW